MMKQDSNFHFLYDISGHSAEIIDIEELIGRIEEIEENLSYFSNGVLLRSLLEFIVHHACEFYNKDYKWKGKPKALGKLVRSYELDEWYIKAGYNKTEIVKMVHDLNLYCHNDNVKSQKMEFNKVVRYLKKLHRLIYAFVKIIDKANEKIVYDEFRSECISGYVIEGERMKQTNQEVIGNGEDYSMFKGIRFRKNFFAISRESFVRFRKKILHILVNYQKLLKGERINNHNDFKMIKGVDGGFDKCKIGSERLVMMCDKDEVINLLSLSEHDKQINDIKDSESFELLQTAECGNVEFKGKFGIERFLKRLYSIEKYGNKIDIKHGMALEKFYTCDESQINILQTLEEKNIVESKYNISIIGNAGSGKSFIGVRWFFENMYNSECIYLTMSESLCHYLSKIIRCENQITKVENEEFNNNFIKGKEVRISTTFDFLKSQILINSEYHYMDAEESFEKFKEFAKNKKGWKKIYSNSDSIAQEIVWNEIHGIIKGGKSTNDNDIVQKNCISKSEYVGLKKSLNKHIKFDEIQICFIYKICDDYQKWLEKNKLRDDNDLARDIIKSDFVECYQMAFIDECQDLTEVQLTAIFHLLRNCKIKAMASDRCQNIYGTYFDEGRMMAAFGKSKPQYLEYNHRATDKCIVNFQNYIIHQLAKYQSLKEEEKIEIKSNAEKKLKPIWVLNCDDNETGLRNLINEFDDVQLHIICAEEDNEWQENDERNTERRADWVASCKGMEFSSVLLWNILSDKINNNPSEAWRYFYVGATRSYEKLLIFERKNIKELERAVAEGLILKCVNLDDVNNEGMKWIDVIRDRLNNVSNDDYISQAKNCEESGRYYAAITIYKKLLQKKDSVEYKDSIMRCEAFYFKTKKQYHESFDCFMRIIEDDCWKEITNIAEKIEMTQNDNLTLKEKMALEIFNVDYNDDIDENTLDSLMTKCRELLADRNEKVNLDVILKELMSDYPVIKNNLDKCYIRCSDKIDELAIEISNNINEFKISMNNL